MNHSKFRDERGLHAYADGELDRQEKQRMLSRLENDARGRERLSELVRTKQWVQAAFEEERAPTRALPEVRTCTGLCNTLRVAASLLVLMLAFGGGWLSHRAQTPGEQYAARDSLLPPAQHVILHVGVSNEARFDALLERTREILDKYTAQGVQVEVVTNGGGLDLVRTAASHHVTDIRQLIEHYDNVHFIACSKGLKRLQAQGEDAHLIKGVQADEPAADHLIRRLTEGWTLIRL